MSTPLFAEECGAINRATFEAWHASAVQAMIERELRLTVGWATKIVNVYLKTRAYVGAQGRPHLREMIHPPIDAGLWLGLTRRFRDRPDILQRTNCVSRIKDIADYDCYSRIIDGCRAAATPLDCELIEVEQLWAGTEFEHQPDSRHAADKATDVHLCREQLSQDASADAKPGECLEYVVSKIGVAVDQLDWSIRLFLDHQAYVPAVTLAGAAEEIIGETLNQSAFSLLKAELCTEYSLPEKVVTKSYLNRAKNWMKHWQGRRDEGTASLELETEAIQYIVRAVANLVAHDRSLPSQAPRFFEWLAINRADLNDP